MAFLKLTRHHSDPESSPEPIWVSVGAIVTVSEQVYGEHYTRLELVNSTVVKVCESPAEVLSGARWSGLEIVTGGAA